MSRLFINLPETPEGKYLVTRRDGTVPHWPHFVIAASDPCAPAALLAYAKEARFLGMDDAFCDDVEQLARDFTAWRLNNGEGDPDAPPHRVDDPATIAKMRRETSR